MNAPRYDSIGRAYTRTRSADPRIARRIIDLLGRNVASILDVGAGTGNYSRELARAGKQVLAIEPSRVMIEQAGSHPNLRWHQSTIEELALHEESFDAAICTLSFHHFQNHALALRNIHDLLKPGGRILIFRRTCVRPKRIAGSKTIFNRCMRWT